MSLFFFHADLKKQQILLFRSCRFQVIARFLTGFTAVVYYTY